MKPDLPPAPYSDGCHSSARCHPCGRLRIPVALSAAVCLALCVPRFLSAADLADAAESAPNLNLTYEQHIRPIFRAHCFDCHGAVEELKGGLDLRLVRLMTAGGDSGPAIVAGEPDDSYLLDRVTSGEMPPGEHRLSDQELATLETWIQQGAQTVRPEPQSIGPGLGITPEERAFWSFQPIRRPEIPEFPPADRVRTPIDALLLEAMPDGLSFSPDADQHTLLLRASFALTGLPPTPEETAAFLNDDSPDAYEKLLDRLLESPHYGERWSRHWLDVAGYADSEGYTTSDQVRPWAYKYRDYVIRSLNADKPFDRFLHEQLAGDELAGPQQGDLTPEQIELLTATGFLRMAADGTGSGANNPEARNQVIADTLKIVSSSLLGLSVACAQCHDHRYDPIPHRDYFALRAVFAPALDWQNWRTPQQRLMSLYTAADRDQAAEIEAEAQKIAAEKAEKQTAYLAEALEKELEKFEESLREPLRTAYNTPAKDRTPEQSELLKKHPSVNITPGVLYQYNQKAADDLKTYDQKIAEVRAKRPPEEFLRVLTEPPGHVPVTKLFHRGDFQQPTDAVAPAGLEVLAPEDRPVQFPENDADLPTTGRRLAFARWLTGAENPVTARVLVNRFWMHHFGRGLVETPADFGRLGMPPTHPELLDWLADEFRKQGWSLKQFHKLVMLSTVYRQSSVRDPEKNALDPENRSYWRKPIIRLDAEIMRDRALAASGQLDRTLFGPPLGIKEDETGQVVVAGDQERRSLYIQARRSQPVAMLQAFDAPVMETNCEQRPASTAATQSLMLMNGEFLLSQAGKLAERVSREAPAEIDPALSAALDEAGRLSMQPPVWQFGYGGFNEGTAKTHDFQPLPHWTGAHWQGGPQLPDPALGWVMLHATGGHTGENPGFAPIRRWRAPADGVLTVTGKLQHGSEHGDGVRGRIVSSRSGAAGEWPVHNGSAETNVGEIPVEAGDTIDFITDCRDDVNSDSFTWTVELTLSQDGQQVGRWESASGFTGPSGPPLPQQVVRAWQLAYCRPPEPEEMRLALDLLARQLQYFQQKPAALPKGVSAEQQAMTNLCQSLLSSNEFLYVE